MPCNNGGGGFSAAEDSGTEGLGWICRGVGAYAFALLLHDSASTAGEDVAAGT